jgi:hypothetical protein
MKVLGKDGKDLFWKDLLPQQGLHELVETMPPFMPMRLYFWPKVDVSEEMGQFMDERPQETLRHKVSIH